jgi:hypothetical protein
MVGTYLDLSIALVWIASAEHCHHTQTVASALW